MTREDPHRVSRKQKRTSRTQADTLAIDVANVSDDIYYDRRNLRDNLENSDKSRSTSSSVSHNNERLNSEATLPTSNGNNSSSSHPHSPPATSRASIVDVPDLGPPAKSQVFYVNTNFGRKDSKDGQNTLDGSHLDWEGDGTSTIATDEKGVKENKNSELKKNKGAAIIVHDESKDEGNRGRGAPQRERSSSSHVKKKDRRASLGLDMPLFSKVSRRNSGVFESVWGDLGNSTEEDSTYSNNSSGGGGGRRKNKSGWKKFLRRVKSHGKMVLLCTAVSVVLIAVMAVLIVMIPIWLRSEERGESAEVGGLAYGEGDGVLMDSSGSTSSGVVAQSEEKDTTSKLILTPPPYNLDFLCNQESLLEEGGYDSCVHACFPSRCCLVDESQTYEVWALHIGANDIEEIGKSITSCFKDHQDTCIRYNEACSVLGKDSLLPKKPPSNMEVLAMNNVEKLHLAETIIRACSPSVEGKAKEGMAECQAICERKACCFVEEEDSVRVTDTGASSFLEVPTNFEEEVGAVEIKNETKTGGRKMQGIRYCGDDPQEFCLTYAGCEKYFLSD